jgi:hypothetical protein
MFQAVASAKGVSQQILTVGIAQALPYDWMPTQVVSAFDSKVGRNSVKIC